MSSGGLSRGGGGGLSGEGSSEIEPASGGVCRSSSGVSSLHRRVACRQVLTR
ncbi:hypothetical protein [Halococcus saccharolyticus]|uniref:hypothetical protein n=1 Tax=Halococcus saccharolyticus TaxID=62319 RepID=UPI0019D357E3|nr:hypothetical protein [Halococcus saccharolyticus]